MSKGQITIEVPHICGEIITVEINWWDYPGNRLDPPEYEEQWTHSTNCPKCNVDLGFDSIFANTVDAVKEKVDDWNAYVPGDEVDHEPEERDFGLELADLDVDGYHLDDPDRE